MDGIILINKPKGITSYDVIRKAKKIFKTTKIGHTGTLDPFAEGLLILCVGKATKLSNKFLDANKGYEGTIIFNNHYDTYDITGNIINSDDKIITYDDLVNVSKTMIGKYMQMPPIYSAIKIDGKKLYEYARKNIEVTVNPREVEIFELIIKDLNLKNEFIFDTDVSKGTYIRSLAVDIATKLDTYATLKTLKRTKIGDINLNEAVDLEDLNIEHLVTVEEIYQNHPKLILSEYLIKLVKNGVYLDERQITTDEDFLIYDEDNNLIALYEVIETNKYKPLIIF